MLKATAERGRLTERDRDRQDRMTNLETCPHALMHNLNKLKPDKHLLRAYFTQKIRSGLPDLFFTPAPAL